MSLLTRAEAARLCRCSVETFDQHVRPQLPVLRVGRRVLVRSEDLEAWMQAPEQGKAALRAPPKPIPLTDLRHLERIAVRLPLTRGQRVRLGLGTPDEVEIEAAIAAKREERRKQREGAG